ncbi:3-beta hydroxysteroid dehydrogenase [Ktedonobacter sp. SOSP1-85]|uniref:NAD-dependent epimerase/dehydratase family protein n=1 Tax=Ktedonobacter sp. SOSP1-85 TaxID=2778367 RepID=UPI0019152AD0|nr:NAD(P)-dependent oxidoreductase [Ktedonobacter sp. SOSP1-85]GHO78919.1 3-beta hydroxysteroid dehydrogenase [Ktedonobacter sp. SOSP1-85]
MRILVTGAFGNVGFSTVQALIEQGQTVRCFDLKSKGAEKKAHLVEGKAEIIWGDIRDAQAVAEAVKGQEAVIHLAYIIPPAVDENPQLAQEVNVGGTRNVIEAAKAQSQPPKVLFSSSLDVFGPTQDQEPPRRLTDPVMATDEYTRHKLEGEEMLRTSNLEWAIYRFGDVPPLETRQMHPIMYTIPLNTRLEVVHTHDVGLAIANGMHSPIWGKVWLIGGGPKCQIRYRDYLYRTLGEIGIQPPPDEAFAPDSKPYCTDWLDTEESQALLQYQRHTFDEIMRDVAEATRPKGAVALILPLLRPLVRRQMLKMSPHLQQK